MNVDEVTVREVMSSPVREAEGRLAIVEAARILCEERIGSLLVRARDDGILTDTDIVRAVKEGRDPERTTVSEVMSSPVLTVPPDATLVDAAERMDEHGVKKLLVTADGSYAGIVTTTDIVDRISPELDDVVAMFVDD